MKTGTFSEALHSLRERFRKNVMENRAMRICLWVQLALIFGMTCSYLVASATGTYVVRLTEMHPHQPVNLDWLGTVDWISFWSLTIGLPILVLILSLGGVLPGTRRKNERGDVG